MKHDDNDDQNEKLIENNEGGRESNNKSKKSESKFKKFLKYMFYGLIIVTVVILLILWKTRWIFYEYIISQGSIYTPSSDFRKYRHLILKNGLEAIVISDPVSITAGASLSVKVGANNDPKDLYGLAHFTEHMLFLGSSKYPDGDDYYKTITENNGNFNAYTDREITNYFFDIHHSTFDKAVDIFSRFFIDPLFHKDKVEKEVNAVNSEYEKNLILDTRKRSQIFASLSKADNPFNRFTTGNLNTLVESSKSKGLDLREELLKFHKKYYVSDKMKLVLYSNKPLDELEEIVVLKFSQIKPSENFDILTDRSKKNFENINNRLTSKNDNSRYNTNSKNNFMKNIQSASNVNSKTKNSQTIFFNPFDKEVHGRIIKFDSISMEDELEINFIQPPLIKNFSLFGSNPYYFFSNIFISKEENSLYDILKKEQLITKLSVAGDREYDEWSDFSLTINLSKKGVEKLDHVLTIVNSFIEMVKSDMINKDSHSYVQKLSKLNFEYNSPYTQKVYLTLSEIAKKSQRFPIHNVLNDNHFTSSFQESEDFLKEYANNLDLEKSIMFIPSKGVDEIFDKFISSDKESDLKVEEISPSMESSKNDKKIMNENSENIDNPPSIIKKSRGIILTETELKDFDPWYKTNYTTYKLNWDKIKNSNLTLPLMNRNHSSHEKVFNRVIKSLDTNLVDELINRVYDCDKNCINKLRSSSNSEPILVSKSTSSQLWHHKETTLNFRETSVNILFNFEKFQKNEDRVNILLLKNLIRKRLRQIKQMLRSLSQSLHINEHKRGIEVSYTTFKENLISVTADIADELRFISNFDSWIEESDFEFVMAETLEELTKEYNSQPSLLAYEYARKAALTNFTTSEDYINYLKNVTIESFTKFVDTFSNEYKTKVLIVGEIEKEKTKDVYKTMNSFLKMYSTIPQRIPTIREKKMMKIPTIKNQDGNYLLKIVYHQKSNKNNALVKCYKIGKNNYKNEVMVNLFNSVLGNIIFQELRTKRQFGYIAKSRIELFDDYYFWCIHVQGSYQLPHVIDDAAIELVDNLIKNKIENLTEQQIKEAKRRNLETITTTKLLLNSLSRRFFNSIAENNFDFPTFKKMENYSSGIMKEDLSKFYMDNFNSANYIFTVYMYSKNVPQENLQLNSQKIKYKELPLIELSPITKGNIKIEN